MLPLEKSRYNKPYVIEKTAILYCVLSCPIPPISLSIYYFLDLICSPSILLVRLLLPPSSSSVTLSERGSGRPWLLFVMAARPLTAALSCGLVLNCAPAIVNVYVHQSNAMCLCYRALWTRRLSKAHRLEESIQDKRFMVR